MRNVIYMRDLYMSDNKALSVTLDAHLLEGNVYRANLALTADTTVYVQTNVQASLVKQLKNEVLTTPLINYEPFTMVLDSSVYKLDFDLATGETSTVMLDFTKTLEGVEMSVTSTQNASLTVTEHLFFGESLSGNVDVVALNRKEVKASNITIEQNQSKQDVFPVQHVSGSTDAYTLYETFRVYDDSVDSVTFNYTTTNNNEYSLSYTPHNFKKIGKKTSNYLKAVYPVTGDSGSNIIVGTGSNLNTLRSGGTTGYKGYTWLGYYGLGLSAWLNDPYDGDSLPNSYENNDWLLYIQHLQNNYGTVGVKLCLDFSTREVTSVFEFVFNIICNGTPQGTFVTGNTFYNGESIGTFTAKNITFFATHDWTRKHLYIADAYALYAGKYPIPSHIARLGVDIDTPTTLPVFYFWNSNDHDIFEVSTERYVMLSDSKPSPFNTTIEVQPQGWSPYTKELPLI